MIPSAINPYFELTKPRIVTMVLVTTAHFFDRILRCTKPFTMVNQCYVRGDRLKVERPIKG